jgi:hypothetical protein
MEQNLKTEIEEYVLDWHWDEESKEYAFEMGKFLFSFMDYLEDQNLASKTKKNHKDNVYLIGMFELSDGCNGEFDVEDLEDGPYSTYDFERKVSDSKYAIKSYESTWRKLDKYIKSNEWEKYLLKIETEI